MNRRSFVTYSGVSILAIATNIGGYTFFVQNRSTELSLRLKSLFNPLFKELAENSDSDLLYIKLQNKGVIDQKGELNIVAVKNLARTDEVIAYKGYYYSQTEIELYNLAYLAHK